MNLTRERGSTSLIIIVVLVIALLGVVGYVFLGKLGNVSILGSGTKTAQTGKDSSSSKALNTAMFDKSFGIAMSFTYPDSWNISKKQDGTFPVKANDVSSETYTITSPDKKYSVVYHLLAGGGIGGACEDENAATVVAAESEDVDGWKGVKLVRAITKSHAGKYLTKVGLVSTLNMMNVKTGGSACNFGPGASPVPSMTLTLTLVDASIHGSSDMNVVDGTSDQGVSSEKEARQLFSGSSFDSAKAILLSTTLK